jgi:hypothetical protein
MPSVSVKKRGEEATGGEGDGEGGDKEAEEEEEAEGEVEAEGEEEEEEEESGVRRTMRVDDVAGNVWQALPGCGRRTPRRRRPHRTR